MKQLVAAIGMTTALILPGCLPFMPADGYLLLRGKVTDESGKPYTDCRVWIDERYVFNPMMPGGNFEVDAMGPPGRPRYSVIVSCKGASEPFRKRVRIGGAEATDLGHIILKRK